MELTKSDVDNLIDVPEEWFTEVEPKELDGDHKDFGKICDKRNDVADFIDKIKLDT